MISIEKNQWRTLEYLNKLKYYFMNIPLLMNKCNADSKNRGESAFNESTFPGIRIGMKAFYTYRPLHGPYEPPHAGPWPPLRRGRFCHGPLAASGIWRLCMRLLSNGVPCLTLRLPIGHTTPFIPQRRTKIRPPVSTSDSDFVTTPENANAFDGSEVNIAAATAIHPAIL